MPDDTPSNPQQGDRPLGRTGPPGSGERLRERIAAAREAIATSLNDVLAELEGEDVPGAEMPPPPAGEPSADRVEMAARQAAEEAVRAVRARLDDQLAHVDRALALVAASERRMIDLSQRVEEAGRTVVKALDTAAQAVDWDQRVRAVVGVEREVADRIAAAERRMRDLAADD